MIVAIASGKGGTGKTTVAVSLAISSSPITLIDADVEEPNANILLRANKPTSKQARLPFPIVNMNKCDFCEECSNFCAYNAIVVLEGLRVFAVKEICKSCGGCALVCPKDAIHEQPRTIGHIRKGERGGVKLIEGELNIAETTTTRLIGMLLDYEEKNGDVIIDCPPGAAHPTVESLRYADYVIMVTEPTPLGFHDLKETLMITKKLNKKVGVIINRSDLGNIDSLKKFLNSKKIPVLLEIPFSEDICLHYSRGISPSEYSPQWRETFRKLWNYIKKSQN
ncbi:(4Fe-4S)-binding protein [bacterium]|nr:MAG: (4Fe-4S)-binding protein [bacterium]